MGRLLGALKVPKNLATQKKRGKIKATPFLNSFKVSGSESEVRILIKILVLKLSKLMTLFVCNCSSASDGREVCDPPTRLGERVLLMKFGALLRLDLKIFISSCPLQLQGSKPDSDLSLPFLRTHSQTQKAEGILTPPPCSQF